MEAGPIHVRLPLPGDALAALRGYAAGGECAWLDPAAGVGSGCWPAALLAARPVVVLEQRGASCSIRIGDEPQRRGQSIWDEWRAIHARVAHASAPSGPGWLGFLGYDAARMLEDLPQPPGDVLDMPAARLALYDSVITLDSAAGAARLVIDPMVRAALDLPPVDADEIARRWSALPARSEPLAARAVPEQRRDEYEDRVRRVREYIAAGDVYQVNLSRRISLEGIADPWQAYARLRAVNPAPFAAFLKWSDRAVLSVSPELLLSVKGRRVCTAPIKGTRPRGRDDAEDRRQIEDLLTSAKERAELAMIVDLHRNDLGRVCAAGSVQVTSARRVEVHPRVLHTVATIDGRLRDECSAIDALAACFPAGSVTGVPKIRAMQIINELEPSARGVYTGAIGHLSLTGDATFSVAIRTVQWHAGAASLHVGGGIVADSDPSAEFDETLAKAAGILRGLGVET
jgi:para-aminobenzoate synthetase component I